MSKIGENPIQLPEKVSFSQQGKKVTIQGPKGELDLQITPEISVQQEDGLLKLTRESNTRRAKSLHGLTRSLLANMIAGVTQGYSKELELRGVGYRARTQGDNLILRVGFSHPVQVEAPEGIEFQVREQKEVTVSGIDKQKVSQLAAEIRAVREPEPYKGKGIRYKGEEIKLKPGKAAKVGEGEI